MKSLNLINPVSVRIFISILVLVLIPVLPWWLSVPILLGLVIYYPLYFEVLFFALIFDTLYKPEQNFPFTALTLSFLVLLLVYFIKNRIRT